MKYIRTKDGVYEIDKNTKETEDFLWVKTSKANIIQCVWLNCIIKKADTIEELCDEFVLKTTNKESGKSYYGLYYYSDIKHFKVKEGYKGVWYGAIWASKGLIYVAKLNDKGELELI